jgi:Zn-dependent metalloprotease
MFLKSMLNSMRLLILLSCIIGAVWAQDPFLKKVKVTTTTHVNRMPKPLPVPDISVSATPSLVSNVRYGGLPALNLGLNQENLRIVRDIKNNQVIEIEEIKPKLWKANSAPAVIAAHFFDAVKTTLKTEGSGLRLVEEMEGANGWKHLKYRQLVHNIPVYGAEGVVHLQADGRVSYSGRLIETPKITKTVPSLTAEAAVDKAFADYGSLPHTARNVCALHKHIMPETISTTELVIYPARKGSTEYRLIWHCTLTPIPSVRLEYFVDAHSGEIVNKYNHICTDGPTTATGPDLAGQNRTINTYQIGSQYYLLDASRRMFNRAASNLPSNPIGAIVTLDAKNTDASEDVAYVTSTSNSYSRTAISAHYNAGKTYEYFLNTHGRNSIDDRGGTIFSIINVSESDGSGLDNAYWNGKAMFYGNGNEVFTKPLAASLDVAAHEMSHGIIQYTANLEYEDQPGALNESFADVFGVCVKRDGWRIGEGITNTRYFPSGALRDMQNPNNGFPRLGIGWQPASMSEFVETTQDNGGVHINSGIPNRAFYLFATEVGIDKAEKVYYKVLSQYLTRFSQFVDCRLAVVRAARELYDASVENAAKRAFDQVGIMDGAGTPPTPDLPVNTGDAFMLIVDADVDDPNNLYRLRGDFQEVVALSQVQPYSKPSVTDDGSKAVFVATDKFIRQTTLNPPVQMIQLGNERWDNVSISKDGRRLAAVSTEIDTAIWVYNYATGRWKRFQLYNPTFSQTPVVTTGPRFADVIEWDLSGEYIIYDCFNQFDNQDGSRLIYWDVGIMRVWDNDRNDFGDGKIEKLFTNLPDGVSIGNPTFSKNSVNVLAFDYWDKNTGEKYVLGVNIAENAVEAIVKTSMLGYASYSPDDKYIAYTDLKGTDTAVYYLKLNSDKITAGGSAGEIGVRIKWPNWYAVGQRNTSVDKNMLLNTVRLYPNPTTGKITLYRSEISSYPLQGILYNSTGQVLKEITIPASTIEEGPDISELANGMYYLQLREGNRMITMPIVKQ